jgi:hypothetical protein
MGKKEEIQNREEDCFGWVLGALGVLGCWGAGCRAV